jgi:hypothetical protein
MNIAWSAFTPWSALAGGALIGLAAALQHQGNVFIDACEVRLRQRLHRLAQVGLAGRGQACRSGIAHEVAHARAGFELAQVLQMPQRLQRRGQADLMAAHELAHGRHALARL